ncbi:MAG TPA: glycerol-3-phosphate dehydrogenase/oxidase [Candidatus Angelobacter sp.]|nr:glycerol-3-phosphate dehydrogenase/oxidase [Candidatus Angelobacter sp.]
MTFSSLERQTILKDMEKRTLDLLVIGGGITGAGIALDATVRGLDVGLVDMQDFAAGTSSRSTKLVHGGLRYLKQFEIKLVAEVGKERAIVYENAPHVTSPEWMLLPMYVGGTFGPFTTSIGLKVYDFLAKVSKPERRSMLSRKQTLLKEPLLKEEGLKGGGYYVEYRTDDSRLTIEVMKEAVGRGTQAVNYAKVQDLLYNESGKLAGAVVVDQLTGDTYKLYAKKIVNAAGPWVDTLRVIDGSKQGKSLHLTKGIHLVIDGKRFPMKQAIYFDTTNGDKRMIFAIPRDGKVYVGTTDTTYTSDPANPRMTKEDRDYLLEAINGMFPEVKLTSEDVESSWAGVRPLIHEDGKSPSEISRKDEIFLSPTGLITIAGGKLTGYRKMAERVVDLVGKQLVLEEQRAFPKCSTDRVKLSGGEVGGGQLFLSFINERYKEGLEVGLDEQTAKALIEKYGSNYKEIFKLIREKKADAEKFGLPPEIYAVLIYGIKEEMVVTPSDFFTRRTGSTLFDINWAKKWKEPVLNLMDKTLKWSVQQKETYLDQFEKELEEAYTVIEKD